MLLLAFNTDKLPLLGGPTPRRRRCRRPAASKPGDDVRIAGVKVGKVTAVDLEKAHVRVDFRSTARPTLGDQTSAAVRIKTILGQKFLALDPAGTASLDQRDPAVAHHARRTTSCDAFSDLATTDRARSTPTSWPPSLDTIADTFRDSPEDVRAAVEGLGRLSRTVASRDDELRSLLDHANGVTGVLSARNAEIVALLVRRRPAAPGAAQAPRGHPHAAGQHRDAGRPAHRPRPRQPRGHPAGADPPQARARRPRDQPGATSTGASRCSRRSCGSSPTPPATAAGSTPTSRTSRPVPGGVGSPT